MSLATYRVVFHKSILHALAYPSMLLIYVFDSFFVPLVMALIWITVLNYESSSNLNQQAITSYYIFFPAISILTSAWHGPLWSRLIRHGELNMRLLKPLHPLAYDLCNNLAEKLIKFLLLLPMLALGVGLVQPNLSLDLLSLILFLVSILLAAILTFLFDSLIGFTAFWFDDTSSLSNFGMIAEYTLGGRVVPIFLFPLGLKQIADALPFRYMLAFPLEILTQSIEMEAILKGTFIQCLWLLTFVIALSGLWYFGLKRYSASGG